MKQLYSAGTALEAHDLRFILLAHGIEAQVFGDNNAWEGAFAFTPQSAPGVFVDDADMAAAREVLQEFLERPQRATAAGKWVCPKCKEVVEGQFDLCWNCESPRGKTPVDASMTAAHDVEDEEEDEAEELSIQETAPRADTVVPRSSPLRGKGQTWLELATVLALSLPLYYGNSIPAAVFWFIGVRSTPSNFYLLTLLTKTVVIAVTLGAIRRSGEPWSNFGIIKPNAFDLIGAFLVCLTDYLVTSIGINILYDFVKWLYGEQSVHRMWDAHRYLYSVHDWRAVVGLVLRAVFIGFSEELVMRGYLIPRLERLLRSTWVAVLVSAGVFALLHLQIDIFSCWSAFLAGLVYGIAFAWSRRLWPIAIAHSLYDLRVFLHHTI